MWVQEGILKGRINQLFTYALVKQHNVQQNI